MAEDKLVTLSSLKEFKRLIEKKLPDMVEAIFESDEEESEVIWPEYLSKTDTLQENEAQGLVKTELLYVPKVINDDKAYDKWEENFSPSTMAILENTCGVCPYLVIRIQWTKEWGYDHKIYSISSSNGTTCSSEDWYTSETKDYYIQDVAFNLADFKPEERTSMVLLVEYFENR